MKRKRIYIKDENALLGLLVLLILVIFFIAFGVLSRIFGVEKGAAIIFGILVVVIEYPFMLFCIFYFFKCFIKAVCDLVTMAIGFRSKEEMKIASYNKRVEKEAKSVFDDLLVKGWKYRYKKEIFQKDVIKTLGKMVKDQSSNQEEE